MGILKGKDAALSHIEQSKTAFLATLSEAERNTITHTMPPKEHYTLKFKRETIKNLKGRVYETMKQYAYEQLGRRFSSLMFCFLSIQLNRFQVTVFLHLKMIKNTSQVLSIQRKQRSQPLVINTSLVFLKI